MKNSSFEKSNKKKTPIKKSYVFDCSAFIIPHTDSSKNNSYSLDYQSQEKDKDKLEKERLEKKRLEKESLEK
ncbi:MAG: hypothetical protein WD512_18175, partial [Candidatus Paceibacterota bacterium]